MVRMSVLTDFKAVVSFVVSPPISTVMPSPSFPKAQKKEARKLPEKHKKRHLLLWQVPMYGLFYFHVFRYNLIQRAKNLMIQNKDY